MFFLIKSAFWLAIVFSCMDWPDAAGPKAVLHQATQEAVAHAQKVVAQTATETCAARMQECLATMQKAAALAEKPTPRPVRIKITD